MIQFRDTTNVSYVAKAAGTGIQWIYDSADLARGAAQSISQNNQGADVYVYERQRGTADTMIDTYRNGQSLFA